MLFDNLSETVLPVEVESELLCSITVKFVNHLCHRLIKPCFKLVIAFIAGLDDLLVVCRVLDAHFRIDFILLGW